MTVSNQALDEDMFAFALVLKDEVVLVSEIAKKLTIKSDSAKTRYSGATDGFLPSFLPERRTSLSLDYAIALWRRVAAVFRRKETAMPQGAPLNSDAPPARVLGPGRRAPSRP